MALKSNPQNKHHRAGSNGNFNNNNRKHNIPAPSAPSRAVTTGSYVQQTGVTQAPGHQNQYTNSNNNDDASPAVNLSPKLRNNGKNVVANHNGAFPTSTNGNMPRSASRNQLSGSVRNSAVSSNTPQFARKRTDGSQANTSAMLDGDDHNTVHSYNTFAHNNSNNSVGGFVSTPSNSSLSSRSKSNTVSSATALSASDLMDSVKMKGIAKRKRKEYSKDARLFGVRKVVDDLNKAIGPEKRKAAINQACIEFSHNDDSKHNAELYLGAASVLCLVLSMSDNDEEVQHITAALEMVYRADREAVIFSYHDVGAALVPLLLRLLERCERGRKTLAEASISNISKILLHMTRISELRIPLVGHQGMLDALERVSTLPLSVENRVLRMRLLANLANSEGNKVLIFERPSLLEATMKIATLDKSESAREYASAVLMDLASSTDNQVAMAQMNKVLATFVKLAVVEDKVETREYAVSGLQNLAFEKQNRMQLVSYGSGVVLEALKKTLSSDSNDKIRRRSAGALTNLACDETAERMGYHEGLLQTLAQVSVSDGNKDVQQRATLALTKLANSVTIEMGSWATLLDALITASRCPVADGIVSAMFRVKSRSEENRMSMATHPRLLETLAQFCLQTQDVDGQQAAHKDGENATKAIAHLVNDPQNHKLICNKHILAALVHGASLVGPTGVVTRDASILALERMAMDHSNRPMMARYPGMLVTIAGATEREMNEELKGIPASSVTGQPRLAKPLLMSLLVAM
eukprot:scaffold1022_cov196-Alexandrium_tamarense.AAC.19